MARQEAHIPVEIWTWPEFLALEEGPQLRYLFLWTQPDLDYTGVISLRERRWAKKSANLKATKVADELDALVDAGLVVVDEDHEELLIRRFMRLDKVYKQPNILRAAVKQLGSVCSSLIRSALGREVDDLYALEDIPDGSALPLEDMRYALADVAEKGSVFAAGESGKGISEPHPEGSLEGFAEPFGDGGPTGSEKEKEKEVGVRGPGEGGRPSFADFWEAYPRKVEKKGARAKWESAIKRADPADIVAGAERYRDDPNRAAKYTKHPTTWLNQDCWEDEPIPGREVALVDDRPSVTDQRVSAWMQMGADMEAAS